MPRTFWPTYFLPNEQIYYQGQLRTINVKYQRQASLDCEGACLRIDLPWTVSPDYYPQFLKAMLLAWLKAKAYEQLHDHVIHYTQRMGRAPRKIGVKLTVSRWGSLGRHNDLFLNWLLIMAPKSVFEYVVVHELCHLYYRSHGPRFWQQVAKWCPTYLQAEKWLRSAQAKSLIMGYHLIRRDRTLFNYPALIRAHIEPLQLC